MVNEINKIFKIKPKKEFVFVEGRQSMEQVEDYATKKVVESKEIVTGNHNADGSRPEVVNVCYGTEEVPPDASTTTEGTLYIQYIA